MSRTVTFTLTGPMQSWAATAGGATRPTGDAPTKSAIIGFVANACGRDRADDISDLAALRYGVRHDRAGIRDVDYHVTGSGTMPLLPGQVFANPKLRRRASQHGYDAAVQPYTRVTGAKEASGVIVPELGKYGAITHDHYLADAAFTIALTGDDAAVAEVAAALAAPARLLYLGRRAYPLAEAPHPRTHDTDNLDDALRAHAPAGPLEHTDCRRDLETDGGTLVPDQPVNFRTRDRTMRRLVTINPARSDTTAEPATDFFAPPETP